jgi:hypothetical protein
MGNQISADPDQLNVFVDIPSDNIAPLQISSINRGVSIRSDQYTISSIKSLLRVDQNDKYGSLLFLGGNSMESFLVTSNNQKLKLTLEPSRLHPFIVDFPKDGGTKVRVPAFGTYIRLNTEFVVTWNPESLEVKLK